MGRGFSAFFVSLVFLTVFWSLPWSTSALAAETVVTFTPQGKVKPIRQVRVAFSAPMVNFGDLQNPIEPFVVSCPAAGKARWADAKNWVYDFDEDLRAGVECKFVLKDTLKTLDGKFLEGKSEFSFTSGAPTIQAIFPRASEWSQIQEDQAFILLFDGTVNGQNELPEILEGAYFSISGIQEQVSPKVLTGEERRAVILAHPYDSEINDPSNEARVVVLQARRKFPYDSKVTLVWSGATPSPSPAVGEVPELKYEYKVRKDFSVTFTCTRMAPEGPCVPFHDLGLQFTADVPLDELKKIVLRKKADGKVIHPHLDVGSDGDPHISYVSFKGPFEESKTYQVELPPSLKDEIGRPLVNQKEFPLEISTDAFSSLAKFAAEFGILEWDTKTHEAILPVTIRKIEAERILKGRMLRLPHSEGMSTFAHWMGKISKQASGEDRGQSIFATAVEGARLGEAFEIPKIEHPDQTEVLGIPIKKPGLYIVEVESRLLGTALLGANRPMYVSTAVLVTESAVHFKKGAESSLVWVTSLNDAKPRANALVSIQDCSGKTLTQARTDAQGVARFKALPESPASCNADNYSPYKHGFYAVATKDDDFAMAHTAWDRGIEPWRFNLSTDGSEGAILPHLVMDRTLLRAGDLLHMKLFYRKHVEQGIGLVPLADLPKVLVIEGAGQTYESEIHWASNGTAEYNWTVPKAARLGAYEVSFKKAKNANQYSDRTHAGSFNVEEFKVPTMKGSIRPPSATLAGRDLMGSVPIDLSVAYLSGGGASRHPVVFRYWQRASYARSFDAFEGFTFSSEQVRPGSQQERSEPEFKLNPKQALTLDATGGARVLISNLKKSSSITDLGMELEFADPNGEIQTSSSRVTLYNSRRLIGVKEFSSWPISAAPNAGKIEFAVVDLEGKPVVAAPVDVRLFKKIYYSHRKRVVGGFYSYEHRNEIRDLGKACSGMTDRLGKVYCALDDQSGSAFEKSGSGTFIVEGRTLDEAGNPSYVSTYFSSYGPGIFFAQADDDRMDVVPERKSYEVGEQASFQVQTPFREGTALVTVEREGVLDSYVMPLTRAKPVVEIPIKRNYAPNVFVSVLAIRGRVSDPQPTAMVDLGKPAFKLGIGKINVGWKPHQLKVSLSSEQSVYKVRENAKVKVKVLTGFGQVPVRGEVIFAAVDEALLLLKKNESWNILESMMRNRPYDVQTYTSQMEVVGKRHFGMKAVPTGGGGGESPTRELFDTLLFWSGKVVLDAKGEAVVNIPLNDSITSFRLVAIAHAGADQFGTGTMTLRTMQDLAVVAGLPSVVREGDRISAEFTIRNSSNKLLDLEVRGTRSQLVDKVTHSETLPLTAQRVQLAAGTSSVVKWDTEVPASVSSLTYEVEAKEVDSLVAVKALISDRIKVTQQVKPAVPTRTYQATLEQIDGAYELAVQKPPGALEGRGGIGVTLQPQIAGGLIGVADYMKAYPYTCLEQRVSRAIVLHDTAAWTALMEQLPTYLDREGLAKFFPVDTLTQGSEVLSAYVLLAAAEAGLKIPEAPRVSLLGGLRKFVEGSTRRHSVGHSVGQATDHGDLTYRKLAALEALARYDQLKVEMLSTIEVAPALWPTSAVLSWFGILQRGQDIPNRDARLQEARQTLLSRLNFQATRVNFSTEETDRLAGLFSAPEINLNRLILALADEHDTLTPSPSVAVSATDSARAEGAVGKDDLVRMVRGALARQSEGHWLTTLGNVWGTLAFEKFSKRYEKEPVTGQTVLSLGEQKSTLNWAKSKGTVLSSEFNWPAPGQNSVLNLRHQGSGKPWVTVQSRVARPLLQPVSSGFKIEKKIIPIEVQKKGEYHKGDILRVQLDIEAQADEAWVVVDDPIPAGSMILGSGLGNDSSLASESEAKQGAWPVFEERGFEGYRAYYASITKGKWSFQYTLRLNQVGTMNLPATRVEAMYSPEVMGEIPNGIFKVVE